MNYGDFPALQPQSGDRVDQENISGNGVRGHTHGFFCGLQDVDPVDFLRTDLADTDIQRAAV